jgi:hypothetical protein
MALLTATARTGVLTASEAEQPFCTDIISCCLKSIS